MLFSRFFGDERGGTLPIFGLAIIPIVGLVGGAIDYGRANAARSAMQSALDATALMVSKEAQNLDPEQIEPTARRYFAAMFQHAQMPNYTVDTTYDTPQPGSFTLKVTASSSLPAVFAQLLGKSEFEIGASADVAWGIKKLELALVLDNTGSMAKSEKLVQLKSAAHSLIDTLKGASKKEGDIKIAIIPFDTTVNIGTSYKTESWVNFSPNNINANQWEGCVQDRDRSYDVTDDAPGPTAGRFPAAQCGSLTTIMPLSEDWTALHGKIDAMTAAGNTNVTIGLAWGWHALTQGVPLTGGQTPAPDREKVIVLLTDGQNTQNRWWTTTSRIDERTALACTNIKAANIKIYSVRVIDGNATLLKACATKASMYYDVDQASELNTVFSSIAQTLANLRLSK
jgi:Flp pilus assembly protein TadG